jgi:hypothetical protein
MTGRWISSGTSVSSTNITGRHNIAEILLKVELNMINITLSASFLCISPLKRDRLKMLTTSRKASG